MKQFFPAKRDFKSLSIRDLLDARETYHVRLARLENVVVPPLVAIAFVEASLMRMVGELDEPMDLNTDTIWLDLIGYPVRAFGGASGELIREIQALFYRYKSIGGFEYISERLLNSSAHGWQIPIRTFQKSVCCAWLARRRLASHAQQTDF